MINLTKAQDATIEFRVRKGDGHGEPIRLVLTADAAATDTSITVHRDHPALSSGDVLIFGEDVLLVVNTAGSAAGAITVPLTAGLAGPLYRGDVLEQLQSLTSYTLEAELLTTGDQETAEVAFTSGDFTIPTQTGANYGKAQLAVAAADTSGLDEEAYVLGVWRTNSGTARPLGRYDVRLSEAGFL